MTAKRYQHQNITLKQSFSEPIINKLFPQSFCSLNRYCAYFKLRSESHAQNYSEEKSTRAK